MLSNNRMHIQSSNNKSGWLDYGARFYDPPLQTHSQPFSTQSKPFSDSSSLRSLGMTYPASLTRNNVSRYVRQNFNEGGYPIPLFALRLSLTIFAANIIEWKIKRNKKNRVLGNIY